MAPLPRPTREFRHVASAVEGSQLAGNQGRCLEGSIRVFQTMVGPTACQAAEVLVVADRLAVHDVKGDAQNAPHHLAGRGGIRLEVQEAHRVVAVDNTAQVPVESNETVARAAGTETVARSAHWVAAARYRPACAKKVAGSAATEGSRQCHRLSGKVAEGGNGAVGRADPVPTLQRAAAGNRRVAKVVSKMVNHGDEGD